MSHSISDNQITSEPSAGCAAESSGRHPRTPKGQHTRMRLLDAASRLFAEHGYAGVGIRAIAKEAGCNTGLIAFHFGNKHNLYMAARETVRDRLASIVLPAAGHLRQLLRPNAAPQELLKGIQVEISRILHSLLMKEYQPERFLLLMREMKETDKRATELYSDVLMPVISALESVIIAASPSSSHRKAHLAAFLLVDAIIGILRDYPVFYPHLQKGRDLATDTQLISELLGNSLKTNFG